MFLGGVPVKTVTPSRPADSKSSGARVLTSAECIAMLEEKQQKKKEKEEKDHCLSRGGVGILPLNGNVHSFVLGSFERKACSIAFGTLGGPLVELFFNYVISAFLTEMLAVKKSSIIIITNAESSILAVKATCHPRAISGHDSMIP
jgi:hypothetical protein